MSLFSTVKKWFPSTVDRSYVEEVLKAFYEKREDYHAMTASGDKTRHAQVRFLECLLLKGCKYAEVGCGGGGVAAKVANVSNVVGFDVSPIAIDKATRLGLDNAEFVCSDAAHLPVDANSFDGTYSFEVLEHVWDPVAVVREMVRITKPGGFILLSAPLAFSLDLHLRKRKLVRCIEFGLAGMRYVMDHVASHAFINITPNLSGDIYPDGDMITAIIPGNFVRAVKRMGCDVEFCDTTYMCAHREGSRTELDFQRNTSRQFRRIFGDHMLLLAYKL